MDVENVPCATKISLLTSLGHLHPRCREPLLYLNQMRNAFCHKPYFEITHKRTRKLLSLLDPTLRDGLIAEGYGRKTPHDILSAVICLMFHHLALAITHSRDTKAEQAHVNARMAHVLRGRSLRPDKQSLADMAAAVEAARSQPFAKGDF
jgi:hypothetical protein